MAPIRIHLRASCLWQSLLLKVKIPSVCGKNLIKKEKPNRKAHWFLFIIGGKEFHTDSTHIRKKEPITQRQMCFPFPISSNFLGHHSAIWRVFHLKMISLSRTLGDAQRATLGTRPLAGSLSAHTQKDSQPPAATQEACVTSQVAPNLSVGDTVESSS